MKERKGVTKYIRDNWVYEKLKYVECSDGEHALIDKHNTVIMFNTKNNILHGRYSQTTNEEIDEIVCNYEDGKLHGKLQYRDWSDKVQIECFYKSGVLDDFYIELNQYNTNCFKKICFYKLGELDGKCKDFHENGYLSKISFYKNGKLDGECKEFNCKGILIKKSFYNNGELVNEITNFNINELQLELHKFNNMVCNKFNSIRNVKSFGRFIRCKNNNITNPVIYCIFKFLKNIKYKNIESIKHKFNINTEY
jgi:antitoxin component YwqK of YwqJK toxin-antitoxin module